MRSKTIGTALAVLLWFGLRVQAAPYYYDLQSYAALQNGYTLQGTIVTDGYNGFLLSTDILSWSYIISHQGTIVDIESGRASSFAALGFGVIATPSALTLSTPTQPNINYDLIFLNPLNTASLTWFRGDTPSFADIYIAVAPSGASDWFQAESIVSPGLSLGGTSEWVIAEARPLPEPASLVMLSLGLAGIGVLAWRHRTA